MSALRRSLTLTSLLAITAVSLTALAPAASAHNVAPPDNGKSVVTQTVDPVTTVTSGLPLWAILAVIAGAIFTATATTLITLAVARGRHPAVTRQTVPSPTDANTNDVSLSKAAADPLRPVGHR